MNDGRGEGTCRRRPAPGPRRSFAAGAGSLAWVAPVVLAGCAAPAVPQLPPADVSPAQLLEAARAADRRIAAHSPLGVLHQAVRSAPELEQPDRHGSGGDSLLFTGFSLAGHAWRHAVTRAPADLAWVRRSLDGLWLLTRSGAPGVLARCAHDAAAGEQHGWPHEWRRRVERGFVHVVPPRATPRGTALPATRHYTRTTRDQLVGLVFGLAVVVAEVREGTLPEALLGDVRAIIDPVVARLDRDRWTILDARGENDTNAGGVGGLIRVATLAVWRSVESGRQARYEQARGPLLGLADLGDLLARGSNLMQYFAWNLRFASAATVWLVGDRRDRSLAHGHVERWLWPHVRNHRNAWQGFLRALCRSRGPDRASREALLEASLRPVRNLPSPAAGAPAPSAADVVTDREGLFVLDPRLRKPVTYFLWVKAPWDAGHPGPPGLADDSGLTLSLPYWLARRRGWIAPE